MDSGEKLFKCSAHTASVMFNTFWNPFLSEAELVCPQSCFLLNCSHAHYPSFCSWHPPAPAPGECWPPSVALRKGQWKDMSGQAGCLWRGHPPAQGDSPRRFSAAQTQQGSQCTLSRSAVRSESALGHKPRNVSGKLKPRWVCRRCEGALENERESRLADEALKRQELRQPGGPGGSGHTGFPCHLPAVGIQLLLQAKDLLGLMDPVSHGPRGGGGGAP